MKEDSFDSIIKQIKREEYQYPQLQSFVTKEKEGLQLEGEMIRKTKKTSDG